MTSLHPASITRLQKKRNKKMQSGKIISYTTIRTISPPRTVALIQLEDKTKVLAPLTKPILNSELHIINSAVSPRMFLSHVTKQGLRVYDVSYEIPLHYPLMTPTIKKFPGYILALTGPSGVGKSTISRLLVKASAGRLAHVPIVTTRKIKNGDGDEYVRVSSKEFERLKTNGEIISFAKIPSLSETRWYGYRAADIENIWKSEKLPVVITETHLLEGLASHFGRRAMLSFGLLPPGRSRRAMLSSLLHRLRARGREIEKEILQRLKNAEHDLAFFKDRADLFDHMIVNTDAKTVVDMMKKQVPDVSL